MLDWDAVRWVVSLAWAPIMAIVMAKRSEEKAEKKELLKSVESLKTELAVLKTTAVTEVGLRDYISERFRESDQIHKRELERLEDKLDHLTNVINEVVKNMPKRKGEGS